MRHCFDVFLGFVYQHLPPGWLTVILAVVAAVTALPLVTKRFDPEKSKWGGWMHALAILVFCSLAALEMAVINHADKVGEERITRLIATTTEIQTTLKDSIHTQAVLAQAQIERQQRHKRFDELLELKYRAAKLSSEIFSLLLSRSRGDPSSVTPLDMARASAYMQQTVLYYDQNYEAEARRITTDLVAHGIRDKFLEDMVQASPVGTLMVREIASHLAAQAERITPSGIKPPPLFIP